MFITFGTSQRSACRRCGQHRRGRVAADLLATMYPALQAAKTQPAEACDTNDALLVRRVSRLRYLRASPQGGFVSLIAGIAMIGLALGVAVLIVVLSVMNGFEEVLRTRILSLTAHATITGVEGFVDDWQAGRQAGSFPGRGGAAPYIEEQGMVTHGDKSSGVLLRGIQPQVERQVADLAPHLVSGSLSDLIPGKYRVILGKDLAEAIGAKVGDRVVVIVAQGDVTPVGVMPRMRAFEVAGICPSACTSTTGASRWWPCRMSQTAAHGRGCHGHSPQCSRICTRRRKWCAPPPSMAAGQDPGPGRLDREHANFFRSIQITKKILFIMLSLMVAVAAFNIVSTMVMVVKSKRRDIAILRTFGSSPRSILSVFVVQGSLIGRARHRVRRPARCADFLQPQRPGAWPRGHTSDSSFWTRGCTS
jgi:lipoprotein-releasing system permease protein